MARRESQPDIVHELIQRVRSIAPHALDEQMACDLERQFKREYGGDKHYIPKPERLDQEKRRAVEAFCREGKPVKEAMAEGGISRATLYRALVKTQKK